MSERRRGGWRLVATVNTAATLASIVVSVAAVADPGLALPEGQTVTPGVETYARATAVRSIALAVVLLYAIVRRRFPARVALLLVTGLLQAGDAVIHLLYASPMAASAAVLASIAIASASWVNHSAPNHRAQGA